MQASKRADTSFAEIAAAQKVTEAANLRADDIFSQLCMLTESFESLAAVTRVSQSALQEQLRSASSHGAAEATMLRVSSALQQAGADKEAALARAKRAADAFKALTRKHSQVRVVMLATLPAITHFSKQAVLARPVCKHSSQRRML